MSFGKRVTGTYVPGAALLAALMLIAPDGLRAQQPQGRGGQPDPAPTGPMAPEKYKNIQVLTNVPADQLDLTMRYVSAAVNMKCVDCHVQEPSGQFSYEKDDKRAKQTAREIMKMVLAINDGNKFGIQAECATCHAGRNRPVGLPLAGMATPEEIAQMTAPPPPAPTPAAGGGRGRGTPGPPVDDVIGKYFDAVGGRDAVAKLQSLSLTGSVTNRAGQAVAFTIEEKPNKYREARQMRPDANIRGYDGADGWSQTGARTTDLAGLALDQALRLNDVGNALRLKEKYTNLQSSGRPAPINGKDTTVVTGRAGPVTEQFYFESESGLLVRRVVMTRTTLGSLREQIDYADYRAAGAVKLPFEIKLTNWNTLDTFKVDAAKVNVSMDDARFTKPK